MNYRADMGEGMSAMTGQIKPDDSVVELAKLVNGYIAGGSVRDLILGRQPKDYDITTPMTPEQMEKVLKENGYKFIPKGVEFGTVSTILPDVGEVELTTYRYETYQDENGRKPLVRWGEELIEDLERRDFTMNTIAYDPHTGELIDPFDGQKDIEDGVIRWVGDAEKRIDDDPLRLLRACRFSGRYGFKLDSAQKQVMRKNAKKLDNISKERIWMEIEKSKAHMAKFFDCLVDTDMAQVVLNQDVDMLNQINHDDRGSHYGETIFQHTIDVLECLDAKGEDDVALKIAGIFHDFGKMDTKEHKNEKVTFIDHEASSVERCNIALGNLKGVPHNVKKKACFIIDQHMKIDPDGSVKSLTKKGADYRMSGIPRETVEDLFTFMECDGKKDKTRSRRLVLSAYDSELPDGRDFLHIPPKERKMVIRQRFIEDIRRNVREVGE